MINYMNKILDLRGARFWASLFLLVLIFRGPTLFNDYYEVDELAAISQTRDYIAGDIPGTDFSESKHALYHLIFKGAYSLSYEHGWVIVHAVTILLVFFTSMFLYLIGKRVDCRKTGVIASVLYGVLISSFNRQFMATNGEIIYNLFLAGGLYFFLIFLDSEKLNKVAAMVLAMMMSFCAWQVKFHGIILLLFIIFFMLVYIPYYRKGLGSRYFLVFSVVSVFALISLIVMNMAGLAQAEKIVNKILSLAYYASSPGRNFSIVDLFIRFFHRQTLLSLWHFVMWIPAAMMIFRFIRSGFKGRDISQSAVLSFAFITYLMIFGGGARIYFHYYMASYPFLSLASAMAIVSTDFKKTDVFKRNIVKFLMIPGAFFLFWNIKDVVIKHLAPQAFYNEGKVLYWTRAVLMGTYNHYLLPGKEYLEAVEYIKKNSGKNDRLFVWGDGPYLNYFADRRMGGHSMWMKNGAYRLKNLYAEGSTESLKQSRNEEQSLIKLLERKKPELIVDVSENGLSGFRVPIKNIKVLYTYLQKKYRFEKNVNGFHIYRRIKE